MKLDKICEPSYNVSSPYTLTIQACQNNSSAARVQENKSDEIAKSIFLLSNNQKVDLSQYYDEAAIDRKKALSYCKIAISVENYKLAKKFCQLSANQGSLNQKNFFAYTVLANQYRKVGNDKKAFKCCKQAADEGSHIAQYTLSCLYGIGKWCKEDKKKAFYYCKLAADGGEISAQSRLSYLYEFGIGCEKDEKKAFDYCQLAADAGHSDALIKLGGFYLNGIGCEKDEKKAFDYCQLAADAGNPEAYYLLGRCYAKGIGCEKDEKKAFDYCKLAADAGNPEAYYYLSSLYLFGEGCEKDEKKAFYYCNLAINRGNLKAYNILRYIYGGGIECQVNKEKELECLKFLTANKIDEKQIARYEYLLGIEYYKRKSYLKAIEYFQGAVDHGDNESLFPLACCYYRIKDLLKVVETLKSSSKDHEDYEDILEGLLETANLMFG